MIEPALCFALRLIFRVIEFFVTMRGSADNSSYFNPQDTDVRTRTVDVLKHKVSFLLNMVSVACGLFLFLVFFLFFLSQMCVVNVDKARLNTLTHVSYLPLYYRSQMTVRGKRFS